MSKFVEIVGKEILTDKNKVPYAQLTVVEKTSKQVLDEETGEVFIAKAEPKRTKVNAWSKKPWNEEGKPEPDLGWDMKIGERMLGSIITRRVEEYEIPVLDKSGKDTGEVRTTDVYTCLVKGDTDDPEAFDAAIHKQFGQNRRVLMGTGNTNVTGESVLKMHKSLTPEEKEILEDQLS